MENDFDRCKKRLAAEVLKRRKEKNISQEQLALEADVDRTYISQLEREIANPSLQILCRVAQVLKCSVTDLMG